MRLLLLMILVCIFTSCGNHKVRFVRATKFNKQEIIQVKNADRASTNAEHQVERLDSPSPKVDVNNHRLSNPETEDGEQITTPALTNQNSDVPVIQSDTVAPTFTRAEKIEIAAQAERNGNNAFLFILLALFVALIAVFIPLFYSASIVQGIVLVISFVAATFAFIFGIKSKTAPFSTKKGSTLAGFALVISVAIAFSLAFFIVQSFI